MYACPRETAVLCQKTDRRLYFHPPIRPSLRDGVPAVRCAVLLRVLLVNRYDHSLVKGECIDVQIDVTMSKVLLTGIVEFVIVEGELNRTVGVKDLLGWVTEVASQLGGSCGTSPDDSRLLLRGLSASFIYLRPVGKTLYVSDRIKSLLGIGESVPVSRTSMFMMLESGYVLPPLTMFEGIYRLWPFTEVLIQGQPGNWSFSVTDRLDELASVGNPVYTYRAAQEAIEECLSKSLQELSCRMADRVAVFTVSGGIDSSLLVMLGAKWFQPRVIAATVRSPGQESEFQRALAAARHAGIRDHVVIGVGDVRYDAFCEYIDAFAEPVFDMAVPGVSSLLNAVRDFRGRNESLLVIEGQCADTVLMGLPHNMIAQMWDVVPRLVRPLVSVVASIGSGPFLKNTGPGRMLYRFRKAARSLAARDKVEALMTSLGVTGAFRRLDDVYYGCFFESIRSVINSSDSFQRGVTNFFLTRILPVREMQKYRLGIQQGIAFAFPFLDNSILNIMRAVPDSFLITETSRKRVLFDLAERVLPREVHTRSTSPFYIGSPKRSRGQFCIGVRQHQGYQPDVLDRETFMGALENLALFCQHVVEQGRDVYDLLREMGLVFENRSR